MLPTLVVPFLFFLFYFFVFCFLKPLVSLKGPSAVTTNDLGSFFSIPLPLSKRMRKTAESTQSTNRCINRYVQSPYCTSVRKKNIFYGPRDNAKVTVYLFK